MLFGGVMCMLGGTVTPDQITLVQNSFRQIAPIRDVANDIGMHESTVSRVVTNKYMHTPQGVFEMKYFFHSGISSSYGENVSSVTIKQRIRKIIENEDPRKPLSDSKIVSILQREGLVLARRTIAKYREELKIPTSNQRKVLY
jgi:RNA polymerase sigma-54 factor